MIFHDCWFLTLVSGHLINWAPLPDILFALAETVLYQSAQFGFLGVSAGNVLRQTWPAIMVYFWGEATI